MCNGCGGKGGWIKPPHAKFFKNECNWHDFNYFLGFTEEHRKKADVQLLQAMQKKVQEEFSGGLVNWFQRRRYFTWCRLYYRAVRLSGKKYFYYGSKEQYVPIFRTYFIIED